MNAVVSAIEYFLPDRVLTNDQLAAEFVDWPAEKIKEKTGIVERHIAAPEQCASDLAFEACAKLLLSGAAERNDIDFLILCTQAPDYILPTTACVLQQRLGLSTSCGAFDFNLGCSGYIYGLGLAKALVESGQAQNVLLVTAETYSKFMHPLDKSVRTIFGDGAAATLVQGRHAPPNTIGPFVYGTDGRGAGNLIVPHGGMRHREADRAVVADSFGNVRSPADLYMNGAEIFTFTLRVVPPLIDALLRKTETTLQDYDLFVFHQANEYMLRHLRTKLKLPQEKFVLAMEHCGNTVSSTIPIALRESVSRGVLKPGHRIMLVGFGVGYSWGAAVLQWTM